MTCSILGYRLIAQTRCANFYVQLGWIRHEDAFSVAISTVLASILQKFFSRIAGGYNDPPILAAPPLQTGGFSRSVRAFQPIPGLTPGLSAYSPASSGDGGCGDSAGRTDGPRRGRTATAAGHRSGGSAAAAPHPPHKANSSPLAREITTGEASISPGSPGRDRGVQLSFAAVDQEDVGHDLALGQAVEAPHHGLVDAGHVIDTLDAADPQPLVARLEGQTVDELRTLATVSRRRYGRRRRPRWIAAASAAAVYPKTPKPQNPKTPKPQNP